MDVSLLGKNAKFPVAKFSEITIHVSANSINCKPYRFSLCQCSNSCARPQPIHHTNIISVSLKAVA